MPALRTRLRTELNEAGVLSADGVVHPAVARWIRTACAPEQWLELRYVRGARAELLRGLVARRGEHTIVALRSGEAAAEEAVAFDADPMQRTETLELVRAYWRLHNADLRRNVLELLSNISKRG